MIVVKEARVEPIHIVLEKEKLARREIKEVTQGDCSLKEKYIYKRRIAQDREV